MEPILTLLAAGAAAALSDVAGQAVKDAYAGLKSVLAGRLASLGLIEQDPKNETFRKAVAEEMQKKDLTADAEVLAKLDALTKALEQEPPDQRERLGVDIQAVHAAHDVIIRQIESLGGIRVHDVGSKGGRVQIEGLKAGGSGGKLTGAGVVSAGLSRLHLDLHVENVHADGDINLTGAIVTVALARAASRYIGKVEEFLEYYSSDREGGPVPFGGRQAELDRLDAWLDDPQAPPRVLLSGPAGRGKSAFLVRWMEHLATVVRPAVEAPAWRLVFFPISLRAGTHPPEIVYEAIAARLAEILEVELPAAKIGYYQDWCRRLCDQIVEQRLPVLIVIDGLDEILGGDFNAGWFPRSPGQNLRLIAAARWVMGDEDVNGWVNRLEWEGVRVEARDLPILDEAGVRDVLASSGAPLVVLANRPEVVEKLQRLSEGEPLLLRLYAEDLWALRETASRLQLKDLDEIEPGFTGYFKKWLEKQKKAWNEERRRGAVIDEASLYAHLAVLGCAHGRLRGPDLSGLVERAHGLQPGYRLEGTLEPAQRFIYGAARRGTGTEAGYVLSHPKLGDFFQGYLDEPVIERTKAAFLAWGDETVRRLNVGELEPDKAPPYLLQFYAQHLKDSNAGPDQFRKLVEDGWRQAWWEYQGGFEGFANDVRIVWQQLRNEAAGDPARLKAPRVGLGGQIRCMLCMSSIRSIGMNMPPTLLVEAVRHRFLSGRQALYLTKMQRPTEQTEVLIGLAQHLPPGLVAEALAAARAIQNEPRRAEALAGLAPHLPPELLSEALAAARVLTNEANRTYALAGLTPYLQVEDRPVVLAEALAAARAIRSEEDRAGALTRLAPYLAPEQRPAVLAEALAAARVVQNEARRARTLAGLAPHLPPGLLAEALGAARVLTNEANRTNALAGLAPYLQVEDRPAVLAEALAAARAIQNEADRAGALARLAPYLTPEQRPAVLTEALAARVVQNEADRADALAAPAPELVAELHAALRATIRALEGAGRAHNKETDRAETLAVLAPHLPPGLLAEALAAARAIQNEARRAEALAGLAPRLPPGLLAEALAAAGAIKDEVDRAEALARLAPRLPPEERPVVLAKVLAAASAIGDERSRADALAALAPHLPPELLAEALAAARAIKDEVDRTEALARLAPRRPPELLAEVFAAARAIQSEADRAEALIELAPHLPSELLGEALCAARAIQNEADRARTLTGLAPHLPPELLAEALAAGRALKNEAYRIFVPANLARHFRPEERRAVVAEALAAARALKNEADRASALAHLAPHLPPEERPVVLAKVLAAASAIGDERSRADELAALAPRLPPELLAEALAAARAIENERSRADALAALAPRLPPELLAEALAAARAIENDLDRADALAAMAPHLPSELIAEALAAVCVIRYGPIQADGLAALTPYLPPGLVAKAFVAACAIGDEPSRAEALAALAPRLPPDLLARALALARTTRDIWFCHGAPIRAQENHAEALTGLAPFLPPEQRPAVLAEALVAARASPNPEYRAKALAALAPHLPDAERITVLEEVVEDCSHLRRPKALAMVAQLAPTFGEVGGEKTISEIVGAIRDVGRWWP